MKRIALIFLALQLISSVVCVYSCKLAFASAIDLPYSVFRIPGSRISDSGSRLEPEGESPGRPDSDCGNGVTGS